MIKKREGAPPRLGAGRLPSGGGTDAGRAPRLADDDRRPAPRLRCGGPWPRMQQAGGQVLGGGVAEKAAASLGMGGEYSHTSPVAISHT